GVHALVAIRNIDRQYGTDVRPVDGAAHRQAQRPHDEATVAPLAYRVDEIEPLEMPVLAEQMDLVSSASQCRGEVRVVDVGTRPGKQIAMEHQDSHEINRPFSPLRMWSSSLPSSDRPRPVPNPDDGRPFPPRRSDRSLVNHRD